MISKYKLTSPIKTFFSSLFLWSSYSTQINPSFLSLDFGNLFWGTFPHAQECCIVQECNTSDIPLEGLSSKHSLTNN